MHRGTPSNPPTLKRQSCDRCHSQKLRCSKGGLQPKDSDSCARCWRKSVPCVYSTPLPKGRPSAHRPAEADSLHLLHPSQQDGPRSASCSLSSQPTSSPTTATPSPCDANILPQRTMLSASFPESQLSAATLADTASNWMPLDGGNLFQIGDQLDWDFPLVTPPGSNSWAGVADYFPNQFSPTEPSTAVNDGVMVDSYHSGSVSRRFSSVSLASPTNLQFSEGRCVPRVPHPLPNSDPNPRTVHQSSNLPSLWPPKNDSVEICIRQLSDMNARLYPVYKASCSVAEAQKNQSDALFSAATFHILTTLLEERTPLKHKCNAISETFGASRSLINIVHRLQATPASPIHIQNYRPNLQSRTPPSSSSIIDTRRDGSSDTSELSSTGNPVVADGITEHESHNLIIGYSILACYTRLLHIYHTLIAALYYDASHATGMESTPPSSLAKLRLILVVQLISHLLSGLQEGVAAYFAHVDDPLDPSVLVANQASLKTVSRLEIDIQDKLKQLNEVLRG